MTIGAVPCENANSLSAFPPGRPSGESVLHGSFRCLSLHRRLVQGIARGPSRFASLCAMRPLGDEQPGSAATRAGPVAEVSFHRDAVLP
jgi:hypothetical protein